MLERLQMPEKKFRSTRLHLRTESDNSSDAIFTVPVAKGPESPFFPLIVLTSPRGSNPRNEDRWHHPIIDTLTPRTHLSKPDQLSPVVRRLDRSGHAFPDVRPEAALPIWAVREPCATNYRPPQVGPPQRRRTRRRLKKISAVESARQLRPEWVIQCCHPKPWL